MSTSKDSQKGVISRELAIISKQSNLNKGSSFSAPDQMVTFFVGQLGVKFVVHREFAMRYSPVLRVAFGNPAENGGGIAGGPLNTYQVKDTSPSAFRLFASWIYTQKLDLKVTHDHALGKMEESEHKFVVDHLSACSHQDMDLCELWVLAETFQIPTLANLVVKTIYEEHENCFTGVVSPTCYSWVYTFTKTPDSPLRRLLIEMCAWASNSWQISATPEHYPHQMIVELVERYKTGIPIGLRDSLKAEFDLAEVMVPEEVLSRPS